MNLFKSTLLAAGMLVSTSMMAIKVHTIGDSTMATYSESTTVTRGWGQMFQQFFTDAVTVNNRAKSGASSKSFYEEAAYWESVKKQIQPGDYVLIQFAHNDEKNDGMDGDEVKAYYESIGDQAKADATDYRGTTASGTYKEYLRKYVEETRALGATPVLVGAICRKYFTGSTIRRTAVTTWATTSRCSLHRASRRETRLARATIHTTIPIRCAWLPMKWAFLTST